MFFGGGGFPGGGFPGGFPGGPGGGGRGGPVDTESYYKVLGLSRGASQAEIKKAYRAMAREHHPDKGGDEALFKDIQEAYDVLSDEEKKALYDEGGKEAVEHGGRGGGGGADDLFSALFGGGGGGARGGRERGGPRKGEPVQQKLNVTLENLYVGKTFKMAINRQRVQYPEGMSVEQATTTCSGCNGQGAVLRVQRMGPMVQQVQARCPDCQGAGRSTKPGVTVSQERKQLEVRVDPGMKHGQKIVLAGEADEMPGMEAGDIIFILNQEEHKQFQRKGADLIMEKEISLREALCGCKFSVKHLDDRTIIVHSKDGEVIKPNSIKQIAGEGMPRHRRPFEKGRLFVVFRVVFPDTLSAEKVKQIKKFLPGEPAPEDLPPVGDKVEEIEQPLLDTKPEEFGQVSFSAETGNAYDSDEEEGHGPGGGQRVQCANQ
jgi:DnaJ family protein A protein 2